MLFRFKDSNRKLEGNMTTHRMPLHSREPRAQHAPRGPDGCLLLSPRPPPNRTAHWCYGAHLPPLPPRSIHPPPTDGCAHIHRHTRTLRHINYTLHTHDIWSLHAVLAWVPHLHGLGFFFKIWVHVVSVQPKQRNTPSSTPLYETLPWLSPLAGLLDILASKLS